MDPQKDERTKTHAGVFDNKFTKYKYKARLCLLVGTRMQVWRQVGTGGCAWVQDMKHDIVDHVKDDGPYKDKAILFCWEHQAIPYMVAEFGLVNEDDVPNLNWGADPFATVRFVACLACHGMLSVADR